MEETIRLSDWFTVVTILVAVLAFYKPEERKLLLLKIGKKKLWFTAFTLFLILPMLLIYDSRIGLYFSSSFTFLAADWAFIILFGIAGFWVWWFFKKLHQQKVTLEILEFYKDATNTLPIDELLRLFVKYEEPHINSSTYAKLALHKPFFQGALQHNPALLIKLLIEIEAKVILEYKLPVIIKNEILVQIAAEKRKGTLSVYNQEPLTINSERDELVLFRLMDCYFSMLNKCIKENKFDPNQSSILNFFLENIFKEVLSSIQVSTDINLHLETPTYNHQLLNSILSYFNEILSELENENKSYKIIVDHFAPIYSNCIVELFEKTEAIEADYLKIQFNSFLSIYFKDIYNFSNTIESINKTLVDKLANKPNKLVKRQLFEPCWKYTDDDILNNGINIPQDLIIKRGKFIKEVVNKILN